MNEEKHMDTGAYRKLLDLSTPHIQVGDDTMYVFPNDDMSVMIYWSMMNNQYSITFINTCDVFSSVDDTVPFLLYYGDTEDDVVRCVDTVLSEEYGYANAMLEFKEGV